VPFNVARSLAALGVPVTLITRMGESDEAGSLALASARQFDLSLTEFQRDAQHPTAASRSTTARRRTDAPTVG
jgi:fructokinase